MQETNFVNVERLIRKHSKAKGILEKSHSKTLKQASKDGGNMYLVQRQNHEEFVRFFAEKGQEVASSRRRDKMHI